MGRKPYVLLMFIFTLFLISCTAHNAGKKGATPTATKEDLIEKYQTEVPKEWGEHVSGVKTRLHTNEKVMALTFDACGADVENSTSFGYDSKLIDFLRKEHIPATLFVNQRWVKHNLEIFKELAKDPLFEIENHGTRHLPLSVLKGKEAYGIKATESIGDVIDEIETNRQEIKHVTGHLPKFFRSGTAYYDEVAVKIANDLGVEIAGYCVLGDAGATYTAEQAYQAYMSGAEPGAIIISHMNHPEKDSSKGITRAIAELKKKGYTFVKLEDGALE